MRSEVAYEIITPHQNKKCHRQITYITDASLHVTSILMAVLCDLVDLSLWRLGE